MSVTRAEQRLMETLVVELSRVMAELRTPSRTAQDRNTGSIRKSRSHTQKLERAQRARKGCFAVGY